MKKGDLKKMKKVCHPQPCGSAVYGLGFAGSLIYFLQQATTMWEGIVGFVKALVWPGVLIYKLLEFLQL
jgi:hypothetical protein